jgi:MFS family permease
MTLTVMQFLLILDSSILGVALPAIQDAMGLPSDQAAWVYNAYMLSYGGCLLIGGRLADLTGPVRMLRIGMVLFAAASLAGGVAPGGGTLIAARAVQGVAAALVAPAVIAVLTGLFPDGDADAKSRRNRAFGSIGAVSAVGGSAGFFLGGALTGLWGWRSVFLFNVPVALALALACWLIPVTERRVGGLRTLPWFEATALTTAVTVTVYVLLTIGTPQFFSWHMLVLAGVAVVLVVLSRRHRTGEPLIPPGLLSDRGIRSADLVCLLVNIVSGPTILVVSLYTQRVLSYSPMEAGLAIVAITMAITASSLLASRFIGRIGLRRMTMAGLIVWACGLFWLSRINLGSYLMEILAPTLVIGFGSGLVFVAFTVTATVGAPPGETGAAGGLMNTSQQIGASVGAAAVVAIADAVSHRTDGLRETVLTSGYSSALLFLLVPLAGAAIAALGMPAGQGGVR